jgi:hypothetical protein
LSTPKFDQVHRQQENKPTFRDDATIGEKYGPAMRIADQTEADAYFEALVRRSMRTGGCDRNLAEQIERSNLGYFAGYFSSETRERVERLFRCVHPVFGSIDRGPPTAQEAFSAGLKLGERLQQQQANSQEGGAS